jgi:upstream activation factor subunit UAF30
MPSTVGPSSKYSSTLSGHPLIIWKFFCIFPVTCPDNAEPRPKKPKIEKSEAGHDGRGRSSGFLAPIPISEGLAKFLGAEDGKVSRADAVKRIWDYIKENNLQDPTNKKMIVCDSKLQELFECDTFVGFGLTKLLSPHFLKA